MAEKKFDKIDWIAVGSVAAVILAIIATVKFVPTGLFGAPQTVLTAKIESHPYKHAGTLMKSALWREEWLQPLEQELKELPLTPDMRKLVLKAMNNLIERKTSGELLGSDYSLFEADRWYDVTIRNEGDVPLKGVFLRFPEAHYWIDDKGQLTRIVERIEIGDIEQKSEKRYFF